MNGTSPAGALMLICVITGQAVDTGVSYQPRDLVRVARAKLHMRCPHCGQAHEFNFADARLRPSEALETA